MYKETKRESIKQTVTYTTTTVSVVYTLKDAQGNQVQVSADVPIFNPQSEQDIQDGLANRAITEQLKLTSNAIVK